jgi:hypothetical protein
MRVLVSVAVGVLAVACSSTTPSAPTVRTASTAPAAPSTNPRGVVRIDGVSHRCEQIVDVAADGNATLLCTSRELVCTVRTYGPDGEERTRTDGVPGLCARYIPRPAGGGYLITHASGHVRVAVTTLDPAGRAGRSLGLDSKEWVHLDDARLSEDDGLFLSITFRDDLMFEQRRLGRAGYFLGAVVRLPPSLDDVSWARVMLAKETGVVGLLPPTASGGGVDAIVNFRGTLRAAGRTPLVGAGTYGWGTARVTLDAKGTAIAQSDTTIESGFAVSAAGALPDGRTAIITPVATTPAFANLTIVDAAGVRSATVRQGVLAQYLHSAGDRTWLVAWDRPTYDRARPGPWIARTIDDTATRRELDVTGFPDIPTPTYLDLASRGDRFALLGVSEDPRTRTPVTFLALGSLAANGAALELGALRLVDHLEFAPGCGGPERKLIESVRDLQSKHRDAFARCGVVPGGYGTITLWPDGGLSTFEYQHPSAPIKRGLPTTFVANPAVEACARAVLEPDLRCPFIGGGNVSMPLIVP